MRLCYPLIIAMLILGVAFSSDVNAWHDDTTGDQTAHGDPLSEQGAEQVAAFKLSPYCPASFELDQEGRCRLQHRYLQYSSPHDKGVGGLKTGLPPHRDGFTPQQIDLGRLLFFDPLLSADQSVACSTCHDPAHSFGDGRSRAIGITGEPIQRSAPSLWNVGFLQSLQWDGSQPSLESQMQGPLYSPEEMGSTPETLLNALNAAPQYRALFAEAFATDSIQLDHVYTALAAFESSLISLNSRYDLYAHGIHSALTPPEIEGLNVFRSFVARCAECHTPPLFTNQQIAVLGVPEAEGRPLDPGAQAVSGDATQRAGFRVPSLRNVALTAPYMHAGNFKTLREAVAFYTGGRGHAVPEGESLMIHWHIWNPDLSDNELDRLVDFLGALTDEGFMPEVPQRVPSGLEPGRSTAPVNR
ncbi:MAG: cytochrome c peroxidase [Halieaceae bacterium]|jgi:cytochrome c peroxidase|nr:cytochrome c peroxidase [Halieaceae bacterium]